MTKKIKIDKLAIDTQIGVYPHEKNIKQRLYISLVLEVDFEAAMTSDKLQDTLDYAKLSMTIKDVLENEKYELIERVLAEVANIVENQFNLARYAIEVAKPCALNFAANIRVSIDRL